MAQAKPFSRQRAGSPTGAALPRHSRRDTLARLMGEHRIASHRIMSHRTEMQHHVSSHLRATWWEEEPGSERGITMRCNTMAWFPKSVISRELKDKALVFRFNYCLAARGGGDCQRPVETPFEEGQRAD